jgi:molybdenum cofactor synthesis domain-containing protein
MKICILTISDTAHKKRELDRSGPLLIELLHNSKKISPAAEIIDYNVVPDEKADIRGYLLANYCRADCILTTGGTGLSKRDVTPEATKEVLERECHGIIMALMVRGIQSTPLAALSRLTAGTVGNCLIVNLPGSPKAVQEGFEVLEDIMPHAVSLLKDKVEEIAHVHEATSK